LACRGSFASAGGTAYRKLGYSAEGRTAKSEALIMEKSRTITRATNATYGHDNFYGSEEAQKKPEKEKAKGKRKKTKGVWRFKEACYRGENETRRRNHRGSKV